jgi:PIN domain
MSTSMRRYIFLDFDSLQKIQPKKLAKVCEKAFIFVPSKQGAIPLNLVVELQKFGKDLKWIVVEDDTSVNLNCYIAFLMGKLHEKVPADIQFALLSDDESFDPLVKFINNVGRNCLRVKRNLTDTEEESVPATSPIEKPAVKVLPILSTSTTQTSLDVKRAPSNEEAEIYFLEEEQEEIIPLIQSTPPKRAIINGDAGIHNKALDIIEKLVQTGNRPSEVSLLQYYVSQHHEYIGKNGTLQKVIEHLEKNNYITVENSEITYHF